MSNVNPTGHDIRPHRLQHDGSVPAISVNNHAPSATASMASSHDEDDDFVSLAYDQPPQYDDVDSPVDPAASLHHFSAMSLNEPGGSQPNLALPTHPSNEPIARAASSMSMRSYQNTSRLPHGHQQLRSATLPPNQNSGYVPQGYYHPNGGNNMHDNPSMYADGNRTSHHGSLHGSDRASTYSAEERHSGYNSPESIGFPNSQNQFPPPQAWQPPPPARNDYNPLYAAASNVLGMGPPPGAHQGPPPGQSNSNYYAPNQGYAESVRSSPSSNFTAPYNAGPSGNPYAGHRPTPPPQPQGYDQLRPALPRGDTSVSVVPSTNKSKAVDLSAPPYTKEYIEQYRQRIKADPDPEAHFLYAKYLIDAARHIRTTAKDQRTAKKYSEVLIQESLKVVRRLATQGEPYDEAQFFLANCHGTGALGLQVDHERAYHLYLQAAKQNHAAACYRVAVCNEIGAGTRKEPSRAAAFYRKAASLGDTAAMYKLGMIQLRGLLEEQKNPREAISWLRRAAEQADTENPHALHELALLYESQDPSLVPYDPVYAKTLFTQAAQLGYTPSQYKLGQCYEYGSLACPVDPRRSIAWYTKAAEKGDPEAELALSGWYLTGSEGVLKQSDSEAYLWARRAANKGLSKAEYAVGYYAEVGIGIKQDVEFAKRWYMRAAAQGNKRAMNRLTEMKQMGNKRGNVARPTRQQAKDECIPSSLVKLVLPPLYGSYLLSSFFLYPKPSEAEVKLEEKGITLPKEPTSKLEPLTTVLFTLPTRSRTLRWFNVALNTLAFAIIVDYVAAPHFSPATDVQFTRVGAVYPDSVKIVSRYPPPVNSTEEFTYRVLYRDAAADQLAWVDGPVLTSHAENDWVSTARLTGLWPNTTYEYLLADQERIVLPYPPSPIKFRTFPDPRLPAGNHFRFISTSCIIPGFPWTSPFAKGDIKGFKLISEYLKTSVVQKTDSAPVTPSNTTLNATDATNSSEPITEVTYRPPVEFMLFLGDFIYADVPYYYGDDKEAYRRLYRRNYNSPSFRKVYEQLPIFHAYDDHEFKNDYVGASNDTKPPFQNASSAFTTYNSDANYDSITPGEHYYEFSYGDVAYFVWDTRRHRTEMGSEEHTMLGSTQLAAFNQWLARVNTTAVYKFVVSSVPFTSLWGLDAQFDSWAGYPEERQAILDAIQTVPNVIILSGDRHEFAAIEFPSPRQGLHSVWEFSTSPLNMFYIPFIRTLNLQSNTTFEKTKTIINDTTLEVSHIQEEIPYERVHKYIATGNHKWATLEVNTKTETPTLNVEVMIDGKLSYTFEHIGSPVKLQTITALTFVPDSVRDIFNNLGFNPSKWF